ALPARG
ncbi:hypothetical protein MKD33_07380, partial [Chromobacterium piscinae]